MEVAAQRSRVLALTGLEAAAPCRDLGLVGTGEVALSVLGVRSRKMPIHINKIIDHSKPLDEKIAEFLAKNPDQFYTLEEIKKALGEFSSFTVVGSKISAEWMMLGFLADVALADELGKVRQEKEKRYAWALMALVGANRVQCVNYQGALRFGVTEQLPSWLEQAALTASP